jgi:hypothetical protein
MFSILHQKKSYYHLSFRASIPLQAGSRATQILAVVADSTSLGY